MLQMRYFTHIYKQPEMDFDFEPEFQWQEDAACRFQPHTLFEIASFGDAIAVDLSVNQINDLNIANFEAANKICGTCPVLPECYGSATGDDFTWTFRAGIPPTRFNPTPQGRPVDDGSGDECEKGHKNWKYYADGTKKCGTCIIAERKVVGITVWKADPTKPCKRGHEGLWAERGKTGKFTCRGCSREDSRASRARKKSA